MKKSHVPGILSLGLAHTNRSEGTLIEGTSSQNPKSVMNMGTCGSMEDNPSWDDIVALRTLYPKDIPV